VLQHKQFDTRRKEHLLQEPLQTGQLQQERLPAEHLQEEQLW